MGNRIEFAMMSFFLYHFCIVHRVILRQSYASILSFLHHLYTIPISFQNASHLHTAAGEVKIQFATSLYLRYRPNTHLQLCCMLERKCRLDCKTFPSRPPWVFHANAQVAPPLISSLLLILTNSNSMTQSYKYNSQTTFPRPKRLAASVCARSTDKFPDNPETNRSSFHSLYPDSPFTL